MSKPSPCRKYYRSIPWGQNTPALLEWQNLFLSFLQDFCIDRGGELVNKRTKARKSEEIRFPSRFCQQSEKKAMLAFCCCCYCCCYQQTLSKGSQDSNIQHPTSQYFCPWLFPVYFPLPYQVIKDLLSHSYLLSRQLIHDCGKDKPPWRCTFVPWRQLSWHTWWRTTERQQHLHLLPCYVCWDTCMTARSWASHGAAFQQSWRA